MLDNTLLYQYKKSISRYEPINADGLTLYPVTVDEYDEFMISENALGFLNQSLPPEYMSLPLLQAFFKLDFTETIKGNEPTGLFASALVGLALALRLKQGRPIEERIAEFHIVTNPDDRTLLKELVFTINGEEIYTITPVMYARLRPIIAAQNGIEIQNQDANVELLQAEKDLAEKNSLNLEYDLDNLITTASVLTKTQKKDVYEWTILQLHDTLRCYKRIIDYQICGVAESQGTSWKGGNPCPHPWFDKKKEGSSALISMSGFAGGQGYQAMSDAGAFDEAT